MKEFESVVTIVWDCNNIEAKDQADYIRRLKESFYESYNIDLMDSEISDIKELV